MKLKEFTDIDIDKKEDIGYDIIDDLKCHMRDDPIVYRNVFLVWLIQKTTMIARTTTWKAVYMKW